MKQLTGFRALDRKFLEIATEQSDIYDPEQNKICATNWHMVNKSDVSTLQIWWHGEMKGELSKEDLPVKQWIFYHSAVVEPGKQKEIISRSIGCELDSKTQIIITVNEKTGQAHTTTK